MPSASPTTAAKVVSWPCPCAFDTVCNSMVPLASSRSSISSLSALPAPVFSITVEMPMPRSFPAAADRSRRLAKPLQSPSLSALPSSPGRSAISYVDPVGVLYGNASGGMKFSRRSSAASILSSAAAWLTSRSTTYAMSGRPAPRYEPTGVQLVSTARNVAYSAGMRYTPVMHTLVLRIWPTDPGDKYAPMSLIQCRRIPRNLPCASSASSPSIMFARPCVSVRNASTRVDTHLTGLPSALAAIISAQYSGYATVRWPKPPPTSCASKMSFSSGIFVYAEICLRSVVTPCMTTLNRYASAAAS